MALQIFVRQPFTESAESERQLVQGVLDQLKSLHNNPVSLIPLTGFQAESESTFRSSFEKETGLAYTPANFRRIRLELLEKADAVLFIRTNYTESGAFEVAYNIYKGSQAPIFFAIHKESPLRQTFLMDLHDLADVTYVEFSKPEELLEPLSEFLVRVEKQRFQTGPNPYHASR